MLDPRLNGLQEKHARINNQLMEMAKHPYQSEGEMKRLKVAKLAVKDEMARWERRRRTMLN